MDNYTITDFVSEKSKLQRDILVLLREFEKRTGVEIDGVGIRRTRTMGAENTLIDFLIEVKL